MNLFFMFLFLVYVSISISCLLLRFMNDDLDLGYATFLYLDDFEGKILEVYLLVQFGEVTLQL